jgi:hypothetical protein
MRKSIYLGIVFLFLCLIGVFIYPGESPPASGPGVILYEHAEYEGKSVTITGDVRNLKAENYKFNDKASSLKLIGGATQVAVFEHENFLGKCQTFTRNVPSLRNTTIGNDRISSVRVNQSCMSGQEVSRPDPYARVERGVVLYEHDSYQGLSIKLVGEIKDLKDGMYNFNDMASSLKLLGNVSKVAVWEDANFIGKCETILRDTSSLGATTVGNDKVSSLIVDQDCNCKKYIKVKNTEGMAIWRVKIYKAHTNKSVLLNEKRLLAGETFAVSFPRENPPEGVDVVIESMLIPPFATIGSQWCKLNDSHEFEYNFGWGAVKHRWGPPWGDWEIVTNR